MANYCFTKYAIEGKKEVLVRVADAINHGEGWMKKSIENLTLCFDEIEVIYRLNLCSLFSPDEEETSPIL